MHTMGLNTAMSLLFLMFLLPLTCKSNGSPHQYRSLGFHDWTESPDHSIHTIQGGHEITPYSWPYLVLVSKVKKNGKLYPHCGGTILDQFHVLSAAHCFYHDHRTFYVTAAEHNYTVDSGYEQSVKVAEIICHPDYNDSRLINDVAVLRLSRPLQMSEKVKTIVLNDDNTLPTPRTMCEVAGWGRISYRRKGKYVPSHVPLKVKLVVWSNRACKTWSDDFTNDKLCASMVGKNVCKGDSGGPLVCVLGGINKLVGVVSSGYRCSTSRRQKPVFFPRVSVFIPWINVTIQAEN